MVRVIEGNRFTLGELDGQRSERIEALSQALDARRLQGAGVARHPRRDLGQALGQPELQPDLGADPRHAGGHLPLPADARAGRRHDDARRRRWPRSSASQFKISLDKRIAGAEAVGAHKTSMLQDVEHGRALELEALVGSVVELGRITDTPTPTIDAIYAATRLLAHTLEQQQGRLRIEPR